MLNLSRSVYRSQPDTDRDLPVVAAIQAVLKIHPGYGFGVRRQRLWDRYRSGLI